MPERLQRLVGGAFRSPAGNDAAELPRDAEPDYRRPDRIPEVLALPAPALECWWCYAPATCATPALYFPHCDVCRAAHLDAARFVPLSAIPAEDLPLRFELFPLRPEPARAARLAFLEARGRGRAPWWYPRGPSPSPTEGVSPC